MQFVKNNNQLFKYLTHKDTSEVQTTSVENNHDTIKSTDSYLDLDDIVTELLNKEEEKEIEEDGMNEYCESYLSKKSI